MSDALSRSGHFPPKTKQLKKENFSAESESKCCWISIKHSGCSSVDCEVHREMDLAVRQRRQLPTDPDTTSSSSYTKLEKPKRSDAGEAAEVDRGLGWFLPLISLGLLRYMSASSNIIHDCDEVFNYWEPLHYLLYKSGFQTWEYRYSISLYNLDLKL